MASNKKENEIVSLTYMKRFLLVCGTVGVIVFILFLFNREYDHESPFDTSFFGTYGDFVGGVIGTAVAFYSVYLLIRTLQNQADVSEDVFRTNESVIEANKSSVSANNLQAYQSQLQLFDNKFNSFMHCYLQAVEAYCHGEYKGREAFEKIAADFIETNFENHNDYYRRSNSATNEYESFYSQHRIYMSVHFRMLYLLVSLISNSSLEVSDKVVYAKLVRGQLSDMEILILRYNCRSVWGKEMQDYCNQFNLLKHLPVMQLFELKKYYKILKEKIDGQNDSDFNELFEGLNSMFYLLKKYAKEILDSQKNETKVYKTSKRYQVKMFSAANGKNFYVEVKKNKAIVRRGGGYRLSPTEKALDMFEKDELSELFHDFFCELFYVSNFFRYNAGLKNIPKGIAKDSQNEYTYQLCISYSKRLALSVKQANERDTTQTAD